MCTIYEGIVDCTINDNAGHPHQVEVPNYLYFPNGLERIISRQHWEQNATSSHVDANTLGGTQFFTHYDHATMIRCGG